MMSNLHKLKWEDRESSSMTTTIFRGYWVTSDKESKGKFCVYYGSSTGEPARGFSTVEDAKYWAEHEHYASEIQPYIKPDSITDISNWFKAAKPEPTFNDYITQLGCHIEEVAEMMVAIGGEDTPIHDMVSNKANELKAMKVPDGYIDTQKAFIDNLELLDALCDQIVTATGVAYMMGFDIEGALKEVIRSNNSKMVNGKFEFDENGKISKPDSYSKPDLTPFIKEV